MFFLWKLSDDKSPQISRTILCILADPNNAVVWIVSTLPLISEFCSPCTSPLVTVPSAPITIGITITFMFHSFFSSLARSTYLPLFLFSFSFTLLSLFFIICSYTSGWICFNFHFPSFFFFFFFFFCSYFLFCFVLFWFLISLLIAIRYKLAIFIIWTGNDKLEGCTLLWTAIN